jgi:ornithine cyclodeaminase/alanine dehydrogenase-like protein (mu-crystallin family)
MPQSIVATPSFADPDTRFLYLSQEDVVAAGGLEMAAIVDVIERAFRVKAGGHVFMPPKVMIVWSDEPGTEEKHGRIMAMPAYVGGEFDVAGLKWIPSVPDNPARRGLPRANALVLLSDRETGLPLAVMDGTVVSAMRTGAVTGVAVRHLAAPGSSTACLLGAGVLAHTQLDALRVVMPELRAVRVFDPATPRARRFCERQAATTGLEMICSGSAEEAVRGAQVVVPATMAVEPTFDPAWLDAGVTVVLVSSLDGPLSLHAVTDLLVVDDWEHESTHDGRYAQRLVEAGIVGDSGDEAVELGDVVAGAHPGRTDAAQRIVVSPVGLGMDDVTTAKHVFDRARELGVGTELRLRSGPPVWE